MEMDQNVEPRYYSKSTANQVPMRETEGREKSNQCNQCAYASYHAGDLRKHLKIHSGEESNKCNDFEYKSILPGIMMNQCDYASSRTDHLTSHIKKESED